MVRRTRKTACIIETIGDLIGLVTVSLVIPVSYGIIAYAAVGH